MKRGDVVIVAAGKPRPAVIVQDDNLATPVDVLICPFTTTLLEAPIYRLTVEASHENGLSTESQLMIDKLGPAPRAKIGRVIGRLKEEDMSRLTGAMALILGMSR